MDWETVVEWGGASVAVLALLLAVVAMEKGIGLRASALSSGSSLVASSKSSQAWMPTSRHWFYLATAAVLTSLGVGVPAVRALGERYATWWPYPSTVLPVLLVAPPPPREPERPVNGIWDVSAVCPGGGGIREVDAVFKRGRLSREFTTPKGVGGRTELVMGYEEDASISITGYVAFSTANIYRVRGSAHRAEDIYKGTTSFGPAKNCPFSAKRKN